MWGLGILGVLVAIAVYGAWTALSLRSHLTAANADAHRLRTTLLDRDQHAAKGAFNAMAENLQSARSRADSPAWWVVSRFPVVGEDARAVRTVADVGAQLTEGSLKKLVVDGDWRLADRLTPRHGRVDLTAVKALAPSVRSVSADFAKARARLRAVDAKDLDRWVSPAFTNARAQVDAVAGMLATADRAFRVIPAMLGVDGPRTWLVAFDNNAEIRATGGMPGAIALIRADHGRISMVKQATATQFPQLTTPILPLTEAERAIYNIQPGVFFQDANFTPEFPRTADLWRARWQQRFGQTVDGVVSVDAVTVSYLLRATGPVTAGGVQLTSTNATDELLNHVYERLPDNAQQDAFFRDVAKAMFAKVTDGAGSPTELVRAAQQGVDEGRIYVHSFDPQVQDVLNPTPIAGNLEFRATRHPQLGIYLNDATGSKMSYYLRAQTHLVSERCVAGRQTLTASMDVVSTAPQDASRLPTGITGSGAYGTARGHQLVLARIYGPVGGALSGFRFGNQEVPMPSVDDRGRPVATTVVDLAPGQTTRMSWRITGGADQPAATDLFQGPGMTSRPARTMIPSSCR